MNFMNKISAIIVLLCLLTSCVKEKNPWATKTKIQPIDFEWHDISAIYFDLAVSNQKLQETYPDFFGNIPDSILSNRREDSLALDFHQEVQQKISLKQVQDSLADLFGYIKDFQEDFAAPSVYSFTGEMPYLNPIAYFKQTHDLVIGLDWFLGKEENLYEKVGIPHYLRKRMDFEQFKLRVAENIARQMVPYEIHQRKFLDQIIYEGKIIALMKRFCPQYSDSELLDYTDESMQWLSDNEAEVYLYFTENDLLFSDNHQLSERFIYPAPFSKFYLENDANTPGRVGVWMGWQIIKNYLKDNSEITLKELIYEKQSEEIFQKSGYKPQ